MQGLSTEEATRRLQQYGPNRLPVAKPAALWWIFLQQFLSPLIYILLAAAALSLWLGEIDDATFISVVLLINAVIGTAQEYSAERSACALSQLVPLHAKVQRDGTTHDIEASLLVPGDVVLLASGEKIPADLHLLEAHELSVDESLLTGESASVEKSAPEDDIYAGSMVVRGRCIGEVAATGAATRIGSIASSIANHRTAKPPLLLRMEKFTLNITFIILGMVALIFVLSLMQGEKLEEIFILSVALAVSAIPEGLPAAITIVLAIGMRRMAGRGVIVRKLLAVEALGSCTFIASDKTGTLTVNELTARRILLPGGLRYDVTGEGSDPTGEVIPVQGAEAVGDAVYALALAGVFSNEAHREGGEYSGDAVDIAFLVLAEKCGITPEKLRQEYPELSSVPYESAAGYAASIRQYNGQTTAFVKGSAEKLLPMCDNCDTASIITQMEALAAEGYRVLALASGAAKGGDTEFSGLTLLGLVGMIDPLRSEAREAVLSAQNAGIEVAMVTGDHPATAYTIARDLGLAESVDEVVSGAEIDAALAEGEAALDALVLGKRVFARVEPAHKQAIVAALMRLGHFVAVTGDGVNDAPALRHSHVGVAMGKRGTDVARESADLIITDDDFSSIVKGIHEGRLIYANIRKVIFLLVTTSMSEIVLFLLALLSGLPLPLVAVQLLWLNLVTESIQHIALAFEPAEGDELTRPPRHPQEAIFNRRMIIRVATSSIYMGCAAFAVFYVLLETGHTLESARNLTLLLMVMFENLLLLGSRSETRSIFRVRFFSNPWILLSIIGAHGLHLLAAYIPPLAETLEITPVSPHEWATLLAVALSVLLLEAARMGACHIMADKKGCAGSNPQESLVAGK